MSLMVTKLKKELRLERAVSTAATLHEVSDQVEGDRNSRVRTHLVEATFKSTTRIRRIALLSFEHLRGPGCTFLVGKLCQSEEKWSSVSFDGALGAFLSAALVNNDVF